MKIPKTLKIIGKTWTIDEVEEIHKAFGICSYNKLRILIEKDLKEDLKRDIILHEVLHAIDWSMNTKLTEEQNTALATGLTAVLIDNPAFAEMLCPRKKKRITT